MISKKVLDEYVFLPNKKRRILFKPPIKRPLTFSQKYTMGALYFMYYICFSPFSFKVNKASHFDTNWVAWKIKTNIFQKLLCLTIHLIVLKRLCETLYQSFGKNGFLYREKNTMLNAAVTMGGIFISGYFFITIWFFQSRFQSLLNLNAPFSKPLNGYFKSNIHSTVDKLQNAVAILSATFSITITVVYFFRDYYKSKNGLEFWNKVRHIIWEISDLCYLVSANLPDVFFPMIALSFRDRARPLITMLKLSTQDTVLPTSVLKEYLMLERYVNKLNKNFGIWILAYTLLIIPFYSLNLVVLFQKNLSISSGLTTLIYLCSTFFFLLMTAAISTQVVKNN